MRIAYHLHLKDREDMVCDFLKQVCLNFLCKLKRDYLIFLKYRVKRLEEIKRNIAILTIKKIWKAKKLSFRAIKEKIIRIKRRKAALQNKEAYQKYLVNFSGTNTQKKSPSRRLIENDSKGSKEFIEGKKDEEKGIDTKEDQDNTEAQRVKNIIERRIKEKVSKSKLAYAIEDSSTKVPLPMMQEKVLNESLDVDTIQSKLLYITASVFAKGRNLSREKQRTIRNFQHDSPRSVSQRKHFDGTVLPPLSIITPAEVPIEPYFTYQGDSVENQHFLNSTISSSNRKEPTIISPWQARYIARDEVRRRTRKISTKNKEESKKTHREFKIPERVNHWIPVARRFSTYIPGIDNSGYEPQKWKPLPLDKRILSTAVTTVNSTKRHRSAAISPTSIISMDGGETNPGSNTNRTRRVNKYIQYTGSSSTQDQSFDL